MPRGFISNFQYAARNLYFGRFTLTSTGDGSGVSTLILTTNKNITITLSGSAKFYTDAGGTLNKSATWDITTGAARTIYLRCPSGTAVMHIPENVITLWGAWTSWADAASLGGDISRLTALTYLEIPGNNTILGDISGFTSLTHLNVHGTNALSGSISGFTLLTYLNLTGSNTVSIDLSLISAGLTYCRMEGNNQIVTYTAGGDWSSITDQSDITVNPAIGFGLSSAEVDLFIQEVESTRAAGRHLHLTLTGSNAARTAASDVAVAAIIADGGTVTTNP